MERRSRSACAGQACAEALPPALGCLRDEYWSYARRVRNIGDDTLDDYWRYVRFFFAELGGPGTTATLAGLSAVRIQRTVSAFGMTHGPGARRWMQSALRSFFRFSHFRGHTAGDFSAAVPAVRQRRLAGVPKAIEAPAVEKLLRALEARGVSGLRDAAIICLLNTYGVRGIHLRRLCLDDVDWERNRIRFPAVKGGYAIELPLLPEAGNRLLAYLQQVRPATACRTVFVSRQPPFMPLRAASSLSTVVCRRLRQAGVVLPAGVSRGTHAFRHAFAARLVGRVPLKHLADMMGHRDPDSTLIYGKVAFSQLQQAALPWPQEVRT